MTCFAAALIATITCKYWMNW